MCKVFASEAQGFIVDEALQVYGGYGFTEEFPLARHYRDARVSRIYEGTNEINRVFIADRVMRRPEAGVASQDSFISELAAKAIQKRPEDQIRMGALADLLILMYAEQSSRLRAKQSGGIYQDLDRIARNEMNARAMMSYQLTSGDEVTLPAPEKVDLESISCAVYDAKRPL